MTAKTRHPSCAWVLLIALLSAGLSSCSGQRADLVLVGGKVVTVAADTPEARGIAVQGDRILAVGSEAMIRGLIGPDTRVIELEGRLAIPGFIEGHGHFMGVGDAQLQLDLLTVESWEQILAMVEDAVADAEPGELIRGRGWHQEKWTSVPVRSVDGVPTHHALSAVSPDNPVLLTHASGHATFANARAMELAGITSETTDPEGGQIVRDENGEPTGMFRERAAGLLGAARRGAAAPDRRRVARLANDEVVAKGITSFQDAGSGVGTIDLFREMIDAGELDVRLWVMMSGSNEDLATALPRYRTIGYGQNQLTVRAIKKSIDGALGPHGAWLLEPYADMPESAGLNTSPVEDLHTTAGLALEHGYQLCVHAIGDRANREVLDVFETAFTADRNAGRGLRWRIEHAQHLSLEDIPRFGEMGVIASMQGVHATSDAPYVLERLGEQRAEEGAYVWQKLLRSGAVVSNGTDAPVEDVDPIASYYATVSRVTRDGSVFFPDQRMTRMEALASYTLNAAYAAFEEDIKGSLEPGKLADIVVLSQDILTIPEERIPETEVVHTIIGGEVKYSAGR